MEGDKANAAWAAAAAVPLAGDAAKGAKLAKEGIERVVRRGGREVAEGGARPTAARGGSGRSHTTVLGENMDDRVVPFAERTGGRTIETVPRDEWAKMTSRQRWKVNDGALRKRVREGDLFRYIGQDPDRPDWMRRKFDLTGSELLRLRERGVPFEVVPNREVQRVIGRS